MSPCLLFLYFEEVWCFQTCVLGSFSDLGTISRLSDDKPPGRPGLWASVSSSELKFNGQIRGFLDVINVSKSLVLGYDQLVGYGDLDLQNQIRLFMNFKE